jgi:HNH endonuclease
MRLEIFIFGIVAFLLYNTYHDGKFTKMLFAYKKYYKMIAIAFFALCFYLTIKRNPMQTRSMLYYTNNMIKYMPIDKSSMDLITPIFDLSNEGNGSFMEGVNGVQQPPNNLNPSRTMLTGNKPIKRSVSETKKKYVASMQDWKCGECKKKLTHTFEVDHKIRLEYGGSNDVTNLVALCRECHGEKTALENM